VCLILFAYKAHKQYPFILAANRDEFYSRPALPADYWPDNPKVLGGRDLEKMGTWLGVTKTGRFAAITNYRDPVRLRQDVRSRGEIVSDFLQGTDGPDAYLRRVQEKRELYNGFNLILGSISCCLYYCNITNTVQELQPGVHGVSNHLLDTPWPKVVRGKDKLSHALQNDDFPDTDRLFGILADHQKASDIDLPDTGVSIELERLLSSIFIESPDYGTRSSTVLLVNTQNRVLFMEKSKIKGQHNWAMNSYEFDIQ
jgi:uncharacterized protein with NRDE domain